MKGSGIDQSTLSRSPVRVAHIIGSTGVYGAERWILAQMGQLDRDRAQVSIINLVDQRETRSHIVVEAQKRGYSAHDFYTGGRANLVAAMRLGRTAREKRYSILHSHGYKSDILGLIAGRIAGIKVVSTPHGWSKENDKKLMLYEKLGKASLKLMDHVCPLSLALYNDLRLAGIQESKITLISNFVDIEEIDAARAQPATVGKRRIGFIGQFIDRKGIEDLVEAFFLLGRSDCELVLVGDGPCREKILRLVRSRNETPPVHFVGYSPRRLEYLKSFDLFVLPSLLEGIPRCIMEAHSARVPVIGTDIDGIRDLVLHDQTGLLVPPRDPNLLSRAILRLLNSPELGAKLAAAGRKIVENKFSAWQTARQYESLYLSVANTD